MFGDDMPSSGFPESDAFDDDDPAAVEAESDDPAEVEADPEVPLELEEPEDPPELEEPCATDVPLEFDEPGVPLESEEPCDPLVLEEPWPTDVPFEPDVPVKPEVPATFPDVFKSACGDSRLGGSVAAFAFKASDAEFEFTLGLEDIPLRASGGSSRGGGVASTLAPTDPVKPEPEFAPDPDPEPEPIAELLVSVPVDPPSGAAPFDEPVAEPVAAPEAKFEPTLDPEYDPEPPWAFEPTGYRAIRLEGTG